VGLLAGRKLALGLQSPLPIMHLGPPGPATPVTQTMGSVSWLRALTKDLPSGPPEQLCRILDAAGRDARQALCQKVELAGLAVFGQPKGSAAGGAGGNSYELQDAVARERREEVRRGGALKSGKWGSGIESRGQLRVGEGQMRGANKKWGEVERCGVGSRSQMLSCYRETVVLPLKYCSLAGSEALQL
jgi:hypothetical protein